jgi:hypothetical protein
MSTSFVIDRMRLRATRAEDGEDLRAMISSSVCRSKNKHSYPLAEIRMCASVRTACGNLTLSCTSHSSTALISGLTIIFSCSFVLAQGAPACVVTKIPKCIWIAVKTSDFNRRPFRLMPCRRAKLRISVTVDDISTPSVCNADAAVFTLNKREKTTGMKERGCIAAVKRCEVNLEPACTMPKMRQAMENRLKQRNRVLSSVKFLYGSYSGF